VTVPAWLIDEPSSREVFAAYQGAIRGVDAAIGRVLGALQQANQADRTIVIFTADHGIPFPRAKSSLYDPGVSVALLVRWPAGGWAGGKVRGEMVSNVDHFPTLLDALGLDAGPRVHGRSYRPLLDGESYRANDAVFCEHNYHGGGMFFDPRRAVRTERFKLIANFTTNRPWVAHAGIRLVESIAANEMNQLGMGRFPNVELYDLAADPPEMHNLAGSPGRAEVLRELKARLLEWMQRTGDPLLDGFPPPPTYHRTMEQLREAHAAAGTSNIEHGI
jgi:arylsulfatase A-like enzyme